MTFYKIGTLVTLFASIFVFFRDDFRSRRDGHFFARDGHYDSNDHREHSKGRFRVVRKLSFSSSPHPRRAYRQAIEGRKALARCLNGRNVYLYIIRKIFTVLASRLKVKNKRAKAMLPSWVSMAFALYSCSYWRLWGCRHSAGLPYCCQGQGLYTVNLALWAFS